MNFIAHDQYGNWYPIEKYPRKELLETLGYKKADKMYIDLKDGGIRHQGYVIGNHWITVLKVNVWKDRE